MRFQGLGGLTTVVITLVVATACGGDGRDGGDDSAAADARPGGGADAPPGGNPDAPPTGGGALGMACTGTGQGTCPVGYECLNLQGGAGPWCSKPCTGQTDPSCNADYTGAGYGMCLLTVTMDGGQPRTFCTIVCADPAGDPMICPPTEDCNGTCPTPLACTGQLRDQDNAVVGMTCQ